MAWKTEINGVEPPQGFRFEEDLDFLYLVRDKDGEIVLRWNRDRVYPEMIQEDIEKEFS